MRRVSWALVMLLAAVARAQDDEPEPAPSVSAEVAVSSRLGDADPTATVRVLTRSEIEELPARSLPDLLRLLPGLDVRRRGIEGIQADIGIRGADFNGTLILVDGQPVNDPESNHLSADLDIPLDAVERIEVLYGGASALWGSEAVGGVVNIVTRGGDLGRSRVQAEARYAHGSDSLDAGTGRVGVKISDRFSVATDVGRSESSGFAPDTEFSQSTARLSGLWKTGIGPVNLSLGYASRRYGAWDFYGTAYPDQQESTRTRTASLSGTLSLGAWTLMPSLSVRAHHDDFVLDRDDPAFYENRHDADRDMARLFARRPLLGGTLAAGFEEGREAIRSTNLGDHGRDRSAFFAEYGLPFDREHPADGGLRVGLREDIYQTFGSRFSPRAGLAATPLTGLRLRASAGTSFRVPTFTELYYVDPQNVGNPALRPEKAVNVEAGGSADLGPLAVDAAWFFRHGTDLIDFVRSSETEIWRAENIRRADTHGLEARLQWREDRPDWLTSLFLAASYTFADLKALEAEAGATEGKYVLDPLHTRWDFGGEALLPDPLLVATFAQLSYQARPTYTSGVLLLDARLSRQIWQGNVLEVYVEGQNLLNQQYQEIPGVPLPGRTLLGGFHLTW